MTSSAASKVMYTCHWTCNTPDLLVQSIHRIHIHIHDLDDELIGEHLDSPKSGSPTLIVVFHYAALFFATNLFSLFLRFTTSFTVVPMSSASCWFMLWSPFVASMASISSTSSRSVSAFAFSTSIASFASSVLCADGSSHVPSDDFELKSGSSSEPPLWRAWRRSLSRNLLRSTPQRNGARSR